VLALRGSSLVTRATYSGDDKVRAEPFEAVEIELAALWGDAPIPSNLARQ
jgi:hypothetical protein